MVTRGREWTKMEHTRNFFFDKVNKAHLINKMKMEEHNILDGKTWFHIKYDNTAPKTALLFTFLPYNMDRAWTYEGGMEHTANGGFAMTHKITYGDIVIQDGAPSQDDHDRGVSLLWHGVLVHWQIRQDCRQEDDRLLRQDQQELPLCPKDDSEHRHDN